jgi:hypothetical protein
MLIKSLAVALLILTPALGSAEQALAAPYSAPPATVQVDATGRPQSLLQLVQNNWDRNHDNRDHRNDGRNNRSHDRDAFRDRHYWDRRHGRGYYERTYGRERRDESDAVAAGFLGFVLGAAIAGSTAEQDNARNRMNDQNWANSCSRRYRSYDPRSGTYLGNDGYRHYCR